MIPYALCYVKRKKTFFVSYYTTSIGGNWAGTRGRYILRAGARRITYEHTVKMISLVVQMKYSTTDSRRGRGRRLVVRGIEMITTQQALVYRAEEEASHAVYSCRNNLCYCRISYSV